MNPFTLYGMPHSLYTGKARSYLIKQHVNFIEMTPGHLIASLIFELFGGEGMVRPAMHYRWNFGTQRLGKGIVVSAYLRRAVGACLRIGSPE